MRRVVESVAPARMGSQFRWLMLSSWVSNFGDGIVVAAGPLLVASQTHSPLLVAAASFLQYLPWLLFGLYAGVQADRLDRRRLVIAGNLARVAVLSALAVTIFTGAVNIAVVLAAMFLLGTAETLVDTTTSTLLPMIVAPADLGVGNARLMFGSITLNRLAGPPIGAALFATGLAWPEVTQAVCVALAALLVARLTLAHVPAQEAHAPVRVDILEGVRWLWGHPPVRTLTLTVVSFNVTYGAAWSVLVLYALDHLHMGEVGFGLLTTAAAVGGIVGTLAYGRLERRFPLAGLMRTCLLLEVLTHTALALTTNGWVAIAIMVVFGAYAFVWGTLSTAVRQRAVPTAFQGRVSSVYLVGLFGGLVVGQLLGGVIAQRWGLTAPFWFAAVGSGLTLAAVWRQLAYIAHADSGE